MTILITTLWWVSGVCSFIYWWTEEQDFEKSTALLAAYVGLIGPIAFIIGWFLHKPKDRISDVWIKQRNK